MDKAFELQDYLPILPKTPEESEYLLFLWDSFKLNYSNQNYHFAFLSYHMMMMSFVYFSLWKIKEIRSNDFNHALIGFGKVEQEILDATSPFTLHKINERTIFRFLKILDCKNEKIQKYVKQVDERNNVAHANAIISFNDQTSIDNEISKIIQIASEIQNYLNPIIKETYFAFLQNNQNPDEREYSDPNDQIKETLVKKHCLSQKDIAQCLACDISEIPQGSSVQIKELHQSFKKLYKNEG